MGEAADFVIGSEVACSDGRVDDGVRISMSKDHVRDVGPVDLEPPQ